MVNRELNDEFIRIIAKQLNVEVESFEERTTSVDMYGLSDGRWIEAVSTNMYVFFMLCEDDPDNEAENKAVLIFEYRYDVLM